MPAAPESPWSAPETVAGFAASAPNAVLMRFAAEELARVGPSARALDLGSGAGRNALPIAALGWQILGLDNSAAMLAAAARRATEEPHGGRARVVLGAMDAIPARDRSFDLVIAHGIWNLARSSAELRAAVREAARVARPGAGLFVFTFSRSTLPPEVAPVPGETFVFTAFSGQPQCFLTDGQLVAELGAGGFAPDPAVPLTEHNRLPAGTIRRGVPVIWEGAFRFAP